MAAPNQIAEQFIKHCQRRLPVMLHLLEELVKISSGTGDIEGAARCLDALDGGFSSLGFKTTLLESNGGSSHLLARRTAKHPDAPSVLLMGHADTVFDKDHPFRGFRSVNGSVFGPGVADMKGGLVVMLSVLDTLSEANLLDAFDFRVLINTDEEAQSLTSRAAIERVCEGADIGLVFEAARESGALVGARRGTGRFLFTVTGKAAHAGNEPHKGRSAILELVHKVPLLDALNNPKQGITVNCGVIQGGSKANIVPDHATLLVDARCNANQDAAYIEAMMEQIAGDIMVGGCTTTVEGHIARPPWPGGTGTDALADVWIQAGRAVGLGTLEAVHAGGGSDANLIHAAGVPVLDGLGPIGGAFHTPDEWMKVDSLPQRSALTTLGLLMWLHRRAQGTWNP